MRGTRAKRIRRAATRAAAQTGRFLSELPRADYAPVVGSGRRREVKDPASGKVIAAVETFTFRLQPTCSRFYTQAAKRSLA